ncbi:MAG: hypothetical protein EBY23_04630, partial [Actinobacteria bacterium]|nr:hypothetical protein [Actinomycetota bacterium]
MCIMKNNVRHFTRNGVVLLAAFTMVATSTLQAHASSPTDSTSTTEADAPTTTAGDGETSTTSPLTGVTTTLPDGTVVELKNVPGPDGADGAVNQPPTDAPQDPNAVKMPEGKIVDEKTGVDLSISSNLVGAAYPGFVFMGIVYVSNIGNTSAGEKSPVSFTLSDIPAFATLKEANPVLDEKSSEGDIGWSCKSNTCTYVEKTATGTKNALLEAGTMAQADLQFNIAVDAQIPQPEDSYFDESAAKAKNGDIAGYQAMIKTVTHVTVTVAKGEDIEPNNNETVIQLLGEKREGGASVGSAGGVETHAIAGVFIDSKVRGPVYPGGPFHMELRYLPTGTETQSGKIKFSEVLPAGLALTKIKVSGTNWTCDSLTALKSCQTTGPDLKPGDFSETLIIDGQVGKAAPVNDKPFTWVVSSTTTTALDESPVQWNSTLSIRVVKTPEPDLAIRLVPRDGKSSIAPPGTVTIDALVRSVYGPAQSVFIIVNLPKGITFKSLDTEAENWECAPSAKGTPSFEGGSTIMCGKQELDAETPETLGLVVGASESTEAGAVQIVAQILAENEAEKYKAGNSVSQDLVVQPQAAPMPGVELSRADEKGGLKVISDGSATKVRIGASKDYSFSAKNLGSKALAAGEVVRFEQFVDSTAIFSGASFAKFAGYSASLDSQKINTASAGKWVCVSGTGNVPQIASPLDPSKAATSTSVAPVTTVATKKSGPAVRCEIKLASSVEPGKATPALNLTVRMSNSAKVGKPEWPVYVTMLGIPEAPIARFGMTVDISEDKTDLVPSFLAPAGPRPGGKAVATLTLRNSGDTDAKSQFVVVPGVKDGRITGVTGDSWKCARLGTALSSGFTVCSRTPALKVGTETPALSVSYESTNKSSKS